MKLKVDENIGRSGIEFLRQRCQDTIGVHEQGLGGKADNVVFDVCVTEGRTLITLDRDFGQVPRFPPEASAGIVVLDLGGPASLPRLLDRLRDSLHSPEADVSRASFGLWSPAVCAFTWQRTTSNRSPWGAISEAHCVF